MNLATIDLKLLLAFEALFEERGVTAAARRIGVGQPGMSAALGRLRALLHDELFVRAAGEMRPTTKAIELAPGITAALSQLRRTLDLGIGFDPATARRSFALGSTDYVATVILPALVPAIRRAAPGIDLRVLGYEKGTVPDMLDRGEIDVALGVFPHPPDRAVVTPLFEERFVGIARAGHPAITAGHIAVEAFADLPHALITTRRDTAGSIDDALTALGLRRRVAVTLPYVMVLPSVLEDTDIVAAIPSRLADRILADHAPADPISETRPLQRFTLPVATPPWTVSMLWPAHARTDRGSTWLRSMITAAATTKAPA